MEVALWLQSVAVVERQATFTGTSTRIGSMEVALWLQWTDKPLSRILPLILILVEVSVKVTCQSTTATNSSHRATSMLLISVKVSMNVASQS